MNETTRLGITLMIVTLIAAAGLALTNYYTFHQIEIQKEKAIKESLNKVIIADSFEEEDNYYDAYRDGKMIGRVLKVEAPGYSSTISALVGIDLGNRITGIDVLSHLETPGLGANIEKESFLGQFIGKTNENLKIGKDGGSIDGVTGATISSRAITEGVREMIEQCPCDGVTSSSPEYEENKTEDLDLELYIEADLNGTEQLLGTV